MANPLRGISNSIGSLKSGEKNPSKKLELLDESRHLGIITKEEFEKEKEKLEKEIREFETSAPAKIRDEPSEPKKSDRSLLYGIIAIVILFASVFAYIILSKEEPRTIEEMHILNLRGKLDPGQGYIYNEAYSFVNLDNQWYTQLTLPGGAKEFSLALRYSPKELENISIGGRLDTGFFDNQSQFYLTFNPTASDLQYTVLAFADLNTHMIKVFQKLPVAACDRNQTIPCQTRPIVTCDDKDKLVFYVKDEKELNVFYDGNCIVIEGSGFDIVRAIDRILYNLYGIMEQR